MIKKNQNIYLFLAAVSLLLAGYVMQKSWYRSQNPEINVAAIKETIIEKEKAIGEIMSDISEHLKSCPANDLVSVFSKKYEKLLESKGLAVFVYQNDSLKYWSDNSLTISPFFSISGLEQDVVCLKNCWAITKKIRHENKIITGLILLKRDYSYENEFLENRFQEDFDLPPNIEISQVETTGGKKITDVNNRFLFSLHPVYQEPVENEAALLSAAFYLAGIVCIVLAIFNLLLSFISIGWALAALTIILALTRFVMMQFHLPAIMYSLDMFGPQMYAVSSLLPSLGDLFASTVFLFVLVMVFFMKIPENFHRYFQTQKRKTIFSLVSLVIIEGYFLLIHYLLNSVIYNSNISLEVYKALNISPYTVLNYFMIAMLFASCLLVADRLIHTACKLVSLKYYILLFSGTALVFYSILFLSGYNVDIYSILFQTAIILIIIFIRFRKKLNYKYPTIILLVFIAALYTTLFIIDAGNEKEKNIRKALVVGLANERDPVAELLFSDFDAQLQSDTLVKKYLKSPANSKKELDKHILNKYFHGFLGRYDMQVTVCGMFDSLRIVQTNEMYKCSDYFDDIISQRGFPIPQANFYFIDNVNGRINYLGIEKFIIESTEVLLYVELNSKLVSEELGYPELLLENKFKKPVNLGEYSYAKYRNDQLIAQTGAYSYGMSREIFGRSKAEFYFVNLDNYNHLVYTIDPENKIVISTANMSVFDTLITFCYIFVFFIVLVLVSLVARNNPAKYIQFRNDFKYRIQFSMVSVLLLSLFLIGGGTVYYNLKQYNKNYYQTINEKAQSVLVELDQKLSNHRILTLDMQDYLTSLLIKFSNVFYSDMNMYDLNGDLLATSRPEVFKKGLISTKMNAEAFRELAINKRSEFIHNERIGELKYLSAYVPFYNVENKQLSYLNLPYFTKQSALKKEISTFIVAIVNIYILLILLTITVTLVISNNITKPLSLIRRKFSEIELGKKNEPIVYKSDDEIGNLVKEYNRMLEELTKSAEMLAKSERESAWREMAKQIAHEIKNPLTPMKLSIQHLQLAWSDKVPDWENRLNKFTLTLIEQIDTLSSIATEFSNFATMPKDHNEVINLAEKIKSSTALFENFGNARIVTDFHGNEHLLIFADKEQLTRVFVNLVKNAFQAIPDNRQGIIKIEMTSDNRKVLVSIADNGEGIPEEMKEKLFVPNFTTKSSGMGLGLAIVKNIIESAHGKIWYETEADKGTVFYLEFAVYKG